ncbi:hypothetical protein A3D11_00950 [Candidatus Peribacteria bacterium RIFCSPHIGHO2_02_FULL_49_16]|nr:MAG: hypothetical protein A2880_03630 [Candidatus Peribacteria bacterium RIFCSPHIGHO2_01_FULL_49_38]OGJ60153.1 MAG: hypothetical protein A3D11_00950 [Candidatus Peribacteria bacterium RIFCSPHIGHO2_02_FULL_49_16]
MPNPLSLHEQETSNRTIKLPSGVTGYAIAGVLNPNKAESVILYQHGIPGTRYEALLAHQKAIKEHVSVICTERSGIGLSEPNTRRKILDHPKDMEALCHELQLEKKPEILATSGGAPYALATAIHIPKKIGDVVIVNGMGPYDMENSTNGMDFKKKFLLWSGNHLPEVANRFWLKLAQWYIKLKPKGTMKKMHIGENLKSEELIREYRTLVREFMLEATRKGVGGIAHDITLLSNEWGFDLEDVPKDKVTFFAGLADDVVPSFNSDNMARCIEDAEVHKKQGQGHMMLLSIMGHVLGHFRHLNLTHLLDSEKDLLLKIRQYRNGGLLSHEEIQKILREI